VHELLALGCFRALGFLLCRPKPANELTTILRQGGIDPSILGLRDLAPAQPTAPSVTLRLVKSLPAVPATA